MKVGNPDCGACRAHPSHALIPCGHRLCYDDFLRIDNSQDLPDDASCATCAVNTIDIFELPSRHTRSFSGPSLTSPTFANDNMWTPIKEHKKHHSAMEVPLVRPEFSPLTLEFSSKSAEKARSTGQQTPATQPESQDKSQYAAQVNLAQVPVRPTVQQVNPPQVPVRPLEQQVSATHAQIHERRPLQHPTQQQWAQPYNHAQERHPFQQWTPQQYTSPYGQMGARQPVHQPMSQQYPPMHGHGPGFKPAPAMQQPNPQFRGPLQAQQPAHFAGQPTPPPNLSDPFVDTPRQPGHNVSASGPVASRGAQARPSTPPKSEAERKAEVAEFIRLIKSGAFESPPKRSNAHLGRRNTGHTGGHHGQQHGRRRYTHADQRGRPDMPVMHNNSGPLQSFGQDMRQALPQQQQSGYMKPAGALSVAPPQQFPQPPALSQALTMPDTIPNPPWFANVAYGYRPTLMEAFDFVPFKEQSRYHVAVPTGVIKVSNIPYATSKNEVVSAIGRNARLVSQPPGTGYYSIHIIMERGTGKTMDCYVEIQSVAEAKIIVGNYERRCMAGRPPRIGERLIYVDMSTQEELMKELFPRARCVKWTGFAPTVYETDEPYNSGFHGFLTGEEMVLVQKYGETPQRCPFASKCYNRTYENLISTLHKYPWFSARNVRISERDVLNRCTLALLKSLMASVRRRFVPLQLTPMLLKELITAALTCPGFSPEQKSYFVEHIQHAGFGEMLRDVAFKPIGPIGAFWVFEVLHDRPEVSLEIIQYYISLLREAANPSATTTSLADISAAQAGMQRLNPFGAFTVNYGGRRKDSLTFVEAARYEWNAVEEALRRVLAGNEGLRALTYGNDAVAGAAAGSK